MNLRALDPAHVRNIADSLKAGGSVPPLVVRSRGDDLFIVDGHHRHAAALLAISEGAPLQFLKFSQFTGNDADAIIEALSTGQAKPHTAIERAEGFKRLIRLGLTVDEISKKSGISTNNIYDLLKLGNADTSIQIAVRDDKLSASTAIEVVKEHGHEAGAVIKKTLDAAVSQGRSRVTRKDFKSNRPKPAAVVKAALALREGLRERFRPFTSAGVEVPADMPITITYGDLQGLLAALEGGGAKAEDGSEKEGGGAEVVDIASRRVIAA